MYIQTPFETQASTIFNLRVFFFFLDSHHHKGWCTFNHERLELSGTEIKMKKRHQ